MPEKAVHSISTPVEALEYLTFANRELCSNPYHDLNLLVLTDRQFLSWPASTKKHQAYDGGLALHTAQVASSALAMLETVKGVRRDLVFTAVLWHDRAKTRDYEYKIDPEKGTAAWQDTEFHETERHLARSYAEFMHAAWSAGAPEDEVERVAHIMLAHHGRREWGSPVEPATAEAWAVHAADMLSARFVM